MRRLRVAVAALAGAAVLALAAGTLRAGAWHPPLRGPGPEAAGVTSSATLAHAATWANHALYALAMLLCVAAAVAFPWSAGAGASPAPTARLSRRWAAAAALAAGVLGAAVLVLVLASPAGDLLRPLEDRFHEGEYLGFLPAFAAGGFERTFLIHGFGMNVLPSLVARALDAGIPAARAVRLLLLLGAWAGFGALLWAASFRGEGAPGRALRFVAMAAVFAWAVQRFEVTERLAVHSWGIASGLWLLARARLPSPRAVVAPGLAVGALLALGLLHNYSEALSFAPVAAILPLLVAARAPGQGRHALAAIAAGALAVAGAVVAAAGPAPWAAALEHVRYWAATSAAIWFSPMGEPGAVERFWMALVPQAAALALLARARARSGWRDAVAEQAEVIVLLLFAAFAMRAQLGRADLPHLRWLGAPAAALLAVVLDRAAAPPPWRWTWQTAALAALVATAWIGVTGRARPRRLEVVASRVAALHGALRAPDDAVLPPDLRVAVEALRREVRGEACFYTLSSEGAYYYLLGLPSCSRFHQVVYARTAEAQAEVVRDLERAAPEVILAASGTWFDAIDGVPVSVSNAAVDRFVRERYRLERTVGTHAIWRRRDPSSR